MPVALSLVRTSGGVRSDVTKVPWSRAVMCVTHFASAALAGSRAAGLNAIVVAMMARLSGELRCGQLQRFLDSECAASGSVTLQRVVAHGVSERGGFEQRDSVHVERPGVVSVGVDDAGCAEERRRQVVMSAVVGDGGHDSHGR